MTPEEGGQSTSEGVLGLHGAGLTLLGKLFAQSCAPLGIDGGAVFQRFAQTGTLSEALGLSDDMLEALYSRAYQYLRLGQVSRAEEVFRSLCALGGKRTDYWLGYGICLRAKGAFSQALEAFDLALTLDPEAAAPHFHKLELFIRENRWEEARAAYDLFEAAEKGEHGAYLNEAVVPFRIALEMHQG